MFAVSGFPEPVPSISLKVECAHVVQHQGGRPQPHMRCARGRYLLPPRRLGIHGEPTLHRRVAARPNPDLFEHPQGLQLAGRLDQPAQHQLLENLVTTTGGIEPEPFKPDRQGIPQVLRPRPPAVVAARPRNRVRPDQRRSCVAAPPLSTPQHPPVCVPTRCDPSTAIHETTTTPPEPPLPPTRSSPSSHTDSPQQAKTPPISAHHTNQNP